MGILLLASSELNKTQKQITEELKGPISLSLYRTVCSEPNQGYVAFVLRLNMFKADGQVSSTALLYTFPVNVVLDSAHHI